jgi:FkbM family methyltransferase
MFDLGAHYGWYMRLMAGSALGGKVFGLEPHPKTYTYLAANAAVTANAIALPLAVGASSGQTILWRSRSRNLSSTTRRVGSPLDVNVTSIDALLEENRIAMVDFIKCDVEGAEINVLRGAQQLLRSTRPPIWMLEVIDPFLAETGISPSDLLDEFHKAGTTIQLYSQDREGQPVQIAQLADRKYGNNIFVVPSARREEFHRAAQRMRP